MEAQNSLRRFILQTVKWFPRILLVVFAVFISMFSFDVFSDNAPFFKTILAFLIHNIPTLILIVILLFSWRWSWIGGAASIILGIIYIIISSGSRVYPVIYLPLFITGILFFLDWFLGRYSEANKTQINLQNGKH